MRTKHSYSFPKSYESTKQTYPSDNMKYFVKCFPEIYIMSVAFPNLLRNLYKQKIW